jgi:hypothetical protein
MSSNFCLFGYTFIYPKLNVLILKNNGEKKFYNIDFMKYYFLSSIFIGIYYSKYLANSIKILLQSIYYDIFPTLIEKNTEKKKIAIVLGFGDTSSSIVFTKNLIYSNYYTILLNSKKNLEFRKNNNFNKKEKDHIENLEELENVLLISYEDLLQNPNNNILNDKIGNNKIKFLIDFTCFRSKNKIENLEKEKEIVKETVKEKEDVDSIYYIGALNYHIRTFMNLIEKFFDYFDNTKILLFNYCDKINDINQKLLFEFKLSYFSNVRDLSERKNKLIYYVKIINGRVRYENKKQFRVNDAIKILKYLDIFDYEYDFS